jgi:uncharacterized delta-60 repeat protein
MTTYNGNTTSETITGTSLDDVFNSSLGDDTLIGAGGRDKITDTEGANWLYGDALDPNAVEGSADTLVGGSSNHLYGGAGNDSLSAAGSSTLVGGSGNDTLNGGTNVNQLEGGSGADLIMGTGSIWTDTAGDLTRTGGDQVVADLTLAQAYGVYDIKDFKAGAGGDVLNLHELLADLVPAGFDYRNPLIDLVQFAANGSRSVTGTNSWMKFVQNGVDVDIQVDPSGSGNGSAYQTVITLRGVTVGALLTANFNPPFSLDGSVLDANIAGHGRIVTLDGNDTVTDNGSYDGITWIPELANSHITTGYGNDHITLNGWADTVYGGAGDDTIDGISSTGSRYYGDDGNDLITTTNPGGMAYGGNGQDTLVGGSGNDTLYGDAGNDSITSGDGDDNVYGGDGRDTLSSSLGVDMLDGGAGDDRLTAGVTNVVYSSNPLTPQLISFDEIPNPVIDIISGVQIIQSDYLSGGADSDTLIAGAGNDRLYDNQGSNILLAGTGNDTITGGISNWINAGAGDDDIEADASSTVVGGAGNDTVRLRGLSIEVNTGDGNDRIELGNSNTFASGVLTLGTGSDTVVFSVKALDNGATPVDILDFQTGAGGDKLDINALLGGLGNYSFDNPFLTGHLRLQQTGADVWLQADVSGPGNGANWQDVAVLRNTSVAGFIHENFLPSRLYPLGNSTPETWTGDVGANTYIGLEGNDSAVGLGGNDLLDGGFGGNDTLVGGVGTDTLFGFDGNDVLYGDTSDASAVGARDLIFGGAGDDLIYGGDGDDTGTSNMTYKGVTYSGYYGLNGGVGNDTVYGQDGQDNISGGDGNDSLDGGADNDYVYGDAGSDTLVGGAGNDNLHDSDGSVRSNNLLQGGAGADNLSSQGTNDTLEGGDDNDIINSYANQSTLSGGAGDDTLNVNVYTGSHRLEGGEGNDVMNNHPYDEGNDVFDGGAGNDNITVSGNANVVAGGAGADRIDLEIYPYNGNSTNGTGQIYLAGLPEALTPNTIPTDTDVDVVELSLRGIEYGRSAPTIWDFHSGAGGDKLDLNSVLGRLSELSYSFGNPFTTGWLKLTQDGADTRLQVDSSGPANGATWVDLTVLKNVDSSTELAKQTLLTHNFTTSFGINGVILTGTALGETLSDSVGVNGVFTGDGADSVNGLGGNDLLDGGFGGNDTLVGGVGTDTLFGFDGNDVLYGDTSDASAVGARDLIFGGAGDDLIYGGDGDDTGTSNMTYKGVTYSGYYGLNGGVGNDTVYGQDGQDNISGGDGNDSLDGGADNDYVYGDAGSDTLVGGAGNDNLHDSDGSVRSNNLLQGGAGADNLSSQGTNDTLEGGDDNDIINSYANQSTLSGGAGDDTLNVNVYTGSHRLEGGEGNDVMNNHPYDEGNDVFDGGAGNDNITVSGNANVVAGGAGADRIDLEIYPYNGNSTNGTGQIYLAGLPEALTPNTIPTDTDVDVVELSLRGIEYGRSAPTIWDFHSGAGGDKLDLNSVLGRLSELSYSFGNPFTTGWLKLTQDGADTRLQVDSSGPANGAAWVDLAVLKNTTASSLTEANFTPQVSPIGLGIGVTLTGTALGETLSDSVGVNGVFTGDGADSVNGLGGNDLLDGGFGGNDTLVGGVGTDTLFGFDGNDVLYGDTSDASAVGARDLIFGGAGDDLIYGGDGDDTGTSNMTYKGVTYSGYYGLNGGVGNDTVYGQDGQDNISGGDGNDSLDGGADNDYVYGDAGSDTLVGGAGNDNLHDSDGSVRSNNLLQGGAGADNLSSQGTNDTLEGGDDNDIINSYANQSTLSGGAGDDTLNVNVYTGSHRLEGGEGNDVMNNHPYDEGNDVFDGGAGNDNITVSGNANVVAGGAGADRIDLEIYPYNGNSTNGTGQIYLAGLPEALTPNTIPTDTDVDVVELSLRGIEYGRVAPVIFDFHSGAGGDKLDLNSVLGRLSELSYSFGNPFTTGWLKLTQDGADTRLQVDSSGPANGAAWVDLAVLKNTTASSLTEANFTPQVSPIGLGIGVTLTGTALGETLSDSVGVNGVFTGDGADSVNGLGGNDLLDGGFGGNDTLVGGVGTDTLFGFDGNDVLYGDTSDASAVGARDLIFGGAGDDLIYGGDGDDTGTSNMTYKGVTYSGYYGLNGGVGNDTVYGQDGQDNISGGDGNDSLDGGADNDYVYGDAGSDTLVGGAGNDNLHDSDGSVRSNNLLQGGAGADNLSSQGTNDTLEGGDDNDIINSYANQSTLSGGAGDDTLNVNVYTGSHRLEGGEGNDVMNNHPYDEGNDVFDGGAGNDNITVSGNANVVAGGAGADRIDLEIYPYNGNSTNGTGQIYLAGLPEALTPNTIPTDTDVDVVELSLRGIEYGRVAPVIFDFHSGAGGDKLDLVSVISRLVELGMTSGADPFATGRLRLTSSGADAVLEVDGNGATTGAQFQTLAVLKGVAPSGLVAANFVQGFTPVVSPSSAPVAQADKTLTPLEDSAANPLNLTSPSDPDGGTVTITVAGLPTYGQVKLATGAAVTNGQTLTDAQLLGLTYTTSANQNGQAGVFRYAVLDDEGSMLVRNVTFDVQPLNDAPNTSNNSKSGTEDTRVVFLASNFPFSDVDGNTLQGIQVTRLPASGTLWLDTNANGVVDNAEAPLNANDAVSLAQLPTLTYLPGLNVNGAQTFDFKVSDGSVYSLASTFTVNVAPVNDAPTLSGLPATPQAVATGQVAALADFTVADVDSTNLTLTLTPSNGTLNNVTDVDGSTPGIQLSGTAAQINAAIAGATFTAAAVGAANIGLSLSDGTAPPVTASYNLMASLPVNSAPTLTTITPLTGASEDTGFTITYAALAAAANEADVDLGDTLSFRVEALSTGSLTKGGLAVVPGTSLLPSGESLLWTPALNVNGTAQNAFTVVAWDGTAASATPVQVSVDVTAVNDVPTLSGLPATPQAITTGQVAALADFTVADVDSTNLTLTLTASNGTINNLTDVDVGTPGIQLSGTAAQVNTALAGATFTATAAGAANIGLTLSDGTAPPVTASYNLTASLPLNSAPVLESSANPALPDVLEGATNPAGITVAALVVDGSVTDANTSVMGTATEAIAITGLNTSLGSWQYSTDGGANWLNIRADLINSTTNELALLLAPTASVRLLPFGDLNGSLSNAITFRAWDMSTGTAGEYATISATGGSTAFSSASDTAGLVVTAVNDAPTFTPGNGTGKVVTDIGSSSYDVGQSLIAQADGKLVVAGYSTSGGSANFAVVRYNVDGSLDTTFNAAGKLVTDIGSASSDEGKSITLQVDGKLVVAGYSTSGGSENFALVRYNVDGSLDTTFNGTGKLVTDIGSNASDIGNSVAVQADGKLVVAGISSGSGSHDLAVVRYNPDGGLDTTFNGTGKLVTDIGGMTADQCKSVTVQADGKLVVAGISNSGGLENFAVVRYNPDGSLDTSFNGTGKLVTDIGSSTYDYGRSMAMQADGKLVVAGYSTSGGSDNFALVRYNVDGSLDTTFNGTGKLVTDIGSSTSDNGNSVTVQADGKLVVAGVTSGSGSYEFALVRYNADGSLDTTFNGTGKIVTDIGSSTYDEAYSVTVQTDGKLVVAGYSSSNFAIVRYNADGTLDTSFGGTPTNTLDGAASYTEGAAATVLDSSVALFDADLAALDNGAGNYAGASITLARTGGANAQDVFSATGALSFSGSDVLLSGVTVGTLTNAAGTLVITFNSNATQARVNQTLSAIGYSNSSDTPPASVQIDWTFSDGNAAAAQGTGGALTATGSTTVNITAANDAPTLGGVPVTAQAITTGQAASLADFTVADVDSTDLSLTLTATNGVINGLTDAYPATTGIQLSGTAAQINTALAGATFTATAAGAASINLSLSDGTALAVTGSYNLTAANPVSQALNGTPGADTLTGTANNDTINGLAGNDTLSGGLGNDTLDGGADIDTASYAGATGAVMAFLWNIQATGADGTDSLLNIENLMGSAFNDRLDGTNGANDLKAGDGNDSLFAYAGADTLTGGVGNDLIDGGADTDTASYAGATGAVTALSVG